MNYLQFHAYCGMTTLNESSSDIADLRELAADRIRRARRRRRPVVILERGHSWEFLEPEGAAMVPDTCGTLTLSTAYPYECRECGSGHGTAADAGACCYFTEDE